MILNEELAKKQKVTKEQRNNLREIYNKLEKLIIQCNEDLNLDKHGFLYAQKMTELEFQLQENWNFPLDANYHTYEFSFDRCTCPRLDNLERFGIEKIYNCSCIIHSFKCKEEL